MHFGREQCVAWEFTCAGYGEARRADRRDFQVAIGPRARRAPLRRTAERDRGSALPAAQPRCFRSWAACYSPFRPAVHPAGSRTFFCVCRCVCLCVCVISSRLLRGLPRRRSPVAGPAPARLFFRSLTFYFLIDEDFFCGVNG